MASRSLSGSDAVFVVPYHRFFRVMSLKKFSDGRDPLFRCTEEALSASGKAFPVVSKRLFRLPERAFPHEDKSFFI